MRSPACGHSYASPEVERARRAARECSVVATVTAEAGADSDEMKVLSREAPLHEHNDPP
ncbi:hypothetical protein GCM10027416_11480 [Okibacterium endophyticum]